MDSLERLAKFVGRWELEAIFPQGVPMEGEVAAHVTFEWILDGTFLLERSAVDHPDAPDGYMVIAPNDDGDTYTHHYFDSRGVVRIYDMTFDGRVWTLSRTQADFSPLDFQQRYTATFGDDGRTIRGSWEICHDGKTWQKDFDLNYARVDP